MAAVSAAGYASTAMGQIKEGAAAKRDSEVTAHTLEQNAQLETAYGQRKAIEERRQARLIASQARNIAAATGNVQDPSAQNALAGIATEGELRAQTQLYQGDETARGLRTRAAAVRRGGADAMSAARLSATGTVLEGVSSMYDKYGGKKKYAGKGYG
jgi:hypothetical protein